MSFNQRKLWDALQNPRSIESTDEMETVIEKYPYFQLLRTLVAKAKHDQQCADAYDWLGKAAIYAPDRRRLRQVFYDELAVTLPEADTFQSPEVDNQADLSEPGNAIIVETPDVVEEEDRDAVTVEAERDSTSKEETVDPANTRNEEELLEKESNIAEADNNVHEDEALREELEKTLHTLQQSKEQLPDSTDSDESEPVATEVASTDEELDLTDEGSSLEKPSTPQQAIIERFMKANPSISRDGDSGNTKPAADLAASSTELQDDLVTENLAEIMLKQGKEAKAIALYEKLMLKYPEKKTYFAQKIDQLKDN